MTKPIHLDDNLEDGPRGDKATSFFSKLSTRFAWVKKPLGRRSIVSQLQERESFDDVAWEAFGPVKQTVEILKVVSEELSLPNHNFIPEDPFLLIANASNSFDDIYLLKALEASFGVSFDNALCEQIKNEDWNLGLLVDFLRKNQTDAAQ